MSFNQWIKFWKENKARVERRLGADFGKPSSGVSPLLWQAVRYSLFSGGKRLRPVLVLLGYSLTAKKVEEALFLASAVEMIHTYSLIHDDLPALDNDDYRRGKPTLHRKYGEGIAILAGDLLLTKAFEVISQKDNYSVEKKALLLKIIKTLSKAIAERGMLGGQVLDILGKAKNVKQLEEIYNKKTGALIQVSLKIGALWGGMKEKYLKALERYGACCGLAFQIIDDQLDYFQDKKKRVSYPHLVGKAKTKERIRELLNQAKREAQIFNQQKGLLEGFVEYLGQRAEEKWAF